MDKQVQRFFEEAIPIPALGGACMYCAEPFSWASCNHFGLQRYPQHWKKNSNHLEEYRNQFLDPILDGYEPLEINGEYFVHVTLHRHMAEREVNPESKSEVGGSTGEIDAQYIPSIPVFPVWFDLGEIELIGEHVFRFLYSLYEKLGPNYPDTNLIVSFGSMNTTSVTFQTAFYHFAKAKNPGWRFFQLIHDKDRTVSGKKHPGHHMHPDINMLFQEERAQFVSKEDYEGLSDKFGILNEQLEETRAKLKMINEISDLDRGIQESE